MQLPKGKTNTLMKSAEKVKLVDRSELKDVKQKAQTPDEDNPEVFVEEGSQKADNQVGSFERLSHGFREAPPEE